MQKYSLSLNLSSGEMDEVVKNAKRFFRDERGLDCPEAAIRQGIESVLDRKLDRIAEDLDEMFTSPRREEVTELERILADEYLFARETLQESVHPAYAVGQESLFSGNRVFSPAKFAAMMEYIASKGLNIYKTNLNKLLFYADLSYFYLRGYGMSGAVYCHRPFGPVADPAAGLLDDLIASERIKVVDRTKHFESTGKYADALEDDEKKMLDWVLSTYGTMGAREISDLSHGERAYRDTRPNEPIAYAYAQFFTTLPPKSLLD